MTIAAFEKDNRILRGVLLNHMINALFDIYCKFKTAKEIWVALDVKYETDDTGSKKYVVARWLNLELWTLNPSWTNYMSMRIWLLEFLLRVWLCVNCFRLTH